MKLTCKKYCCKHINMNKPRRMGYAYYGPKTPTLNEQKAALAVADCDEVFEDKAPARTHRAAMTHPENMVIGDVFIITSPSIIGSGEKDVADTLRRIGAAGCFVQVLGEDPVLYVDEDKIAAFAKLALKTSRRINAQQMVQTRVRVGRTGKLDHITPEQALCVLWLWDDPRTTRDLVADFCNACLGCKGVTRVNLDTWVKKTRPVAKKEGGSDDV